nr:MurR/RpiR family transcriptional regulator [Martelella limonii]
MASGFASYPDATFERLTATIRSEIPNLPKQEAKVAQFLLLNLGSLSFETGKSIAQKARVSEVTVGRVLRRFGCDGMKELKELLRQRYSVSGTVANKKDDISARWRSTLNAELDAIRTVFAQLDGQLFEEATRRLSSAEEVFVTGFQTVRGLAEDAARRLSLARSHVRYLSPHDGMLAEWLSSPAPENSCLLMVDVVPYAGEAQSLAQLARQQNRSVVLVTDEYCHWANEVAHATLFAPSSTGLFLESTLGLNVALALLIDGVARASPDDAQARLREWKGLTRQLKLF